jgi:hypothetical protein
MGMGLRKQKRIGSKDTFFVFYVNNGFGGVMITSPSTGVEIRVRGVRTRIL